MYAVKSPKSSQTIETKKLIRIAKKNIDNGMDWQEAIKPIEAIEDNIQRQLAIHSIIKYI